MAGRPPKPASLKVLEGNRARREIPKEPPAVGVPVKPNGLCEVAAAHWDFVLGHVISMGVAKEIDSPKLQMLCESWALYRRAYEAAKVDPLDKEIRLAVRGYLADWSKLASDFAIGPVSRTKLAIQEKKSDDLDEFLKVTG